MEAEELKRRTKEFAKRVIRLCRNLPRTEECYLIRRQLFKAGTSVGANYRAACRARSRADFISKLGIVLEEADETLYWLEILVETEIVPRPRLDRAAHGREQRVDRHLRQQLEYSEAVNRPAGAISASNLKSAICNPEGDAS